MDIGWGEMLLLAALALVIFGPDKLPKVASDAGRMVRRLREMAQSAQTDLTDSAGVDVRGIAKDLRSVADLHPKRLINSAVSDFSLAGLTAEAAMADPDSEDSQGKRKVELGSASPPPLRNTASDPAQPRFDPDAT